MYITMKTLLFAVQAGIYIFDTSRQALARPFGSGDAIALRYANGGVAVVKNNGWQGCSIEQLPWVPTAEEKKAWDNRLDTQISREKILFGGDTIDDAWWGQNFTAPLEPQLVCV